MINSSAMSTKSDCGVGGARPVSSVSRCEGANTSSSNNKRNWCSESHLEQRDPCVGGRLQAGSHKPYKALSLNTLLKVSHLR